MGHQGIHPHSRLRLNHSSYYLITGGSDKTLHTDRASIECFDPVTEKWSFVTEMDKGRSGLVLVSLDHFLYVLGGRAKYLDRYDNWVER